MAVTLGAGGIGIARAVAPAGAVTFVPITPCRIVDTRPAPDQVGPRSTPLDPGETYTVSTQQDSGQCADMIPASATGVSLNVTTTDATMLTFLTIWPTGTQMPLASSLNPSPGQPPTPNAVTTGLSPAGAFDVYNLQGTVNVLADVNGYYVDHDHDDRYYTEAEIDARVPASASISLQGGAFTPFEGELTNGGSTTCYRHESSTGFIRHSVPLPTGTTITRINVRSYSSAVVAPGFIVELRRQLADSGATEVVQSIQPIAHNSTFGVTERLLTTPETVDPGESLFLTFRSVQDSIGLCSIEVVFLRS